MAGTVSGIDVFSPEVQIDPYPVWRELRAHTPVYREPKYGNYVLTRFDDVYAVLRDHSTFSSAAGIGPNPNTPGGANQTIVTSDPPRHTHLRNLVNRAFTPRTVQAMVPRMERIVADLLAARPADRFDLVETLSYPLPVIVIAELLGIPAERRADFKRWSDALVGTFEGAFDASRMVVLQEMFVFLAAAIAERRAEPLEDLITALTRAEVDGQRLNEGEVMSFALILLVAGNETTTNLISNLMNILGRRPDLWARLRADRSLVENAIEETLRYDSPVQMLGRGVVRDVEVRGVRLKPGDHIMAAFGAANRDEAEFPEGETFKVDRDFSRHVAFGHGIHYCLGAPLARAEAKVALNALLDGFVEISLPDQGKRTLSSVIHGFEHLSFEGRPA
ncbi:MAG: cytochrome P450 [Dehalococcoidia bacterium]